MPKVGRVGLAHEGAQEPAKRILPPAPADAGAGAGADAMVGLRDPLGPTPPPPPPPPDAARCASCESILRMGAGRGWSSETARAASAREGEGDSDLRFQNMARGGVAKRGMQSQCVGAG